GKPHPHPCERLRRLGEGDDAEPERHAQADIALEKVDRLDGDQGRGTRAAVHCLVSPLRTNTPLIGAPLALRAFPPRGGLTPCPAACRCGACRRRTLPVSSCPACADAATRSRS